MATEHGVSLATTREGRKVRALTHHSPATKPTKADDAYETLKRMIVTLQLQPGEPIEERALIARLDIGRTPLREAIHRLSGEQLVTAIPRRGYFVSELSLSDLNEMIAARDVVEPQVARLAARQIPIEAINHLRTVIDEAIEQIDETDWEGSVQHDQEFHQTIALSSRNRYLAGIANQLNTSMLRYWYISFAMVGNLTPTFQHHHHLLDLIETRDEDAVEAAMHEHIDLFRQRIKQVIGNGMGFPMGRVAVSS